MDGASFVSDLFSRLKSRGLSLFLYFRSSACSAYVVLCSGSKKFVGLGRIGRKCERIWVADSFGMLKLVFLFFSSSVGLGAVWGFFSTIFFPLFDRVLFNGFGVDVSLVGVGLGVLDGGVIARSSLLTSEEKRDLGGRDLLSSCFCCLKIGNVFDSCGFCLHA